MNAIDYCGIEPPEDFTQLSVVPTFEDILSDQTNQYLRKNITNGAYKDVNHYLDVQFRLLREDFLYPLRSGVQNLRQIISEARFNDRIVTRKTNLRVLSNEAKSSISKIESLSVYFDCSIEKMVTSEVGMVYQVRISDEKIKSINWSMSKKLMFGSLICMSNDFFENTCLMGCISERDSAQLKEGIIMVKFNVDAEIKLNVNAMLGSGFIMLETSAYFESYKHVLKALVSFRQDGEENFPFRENIVFCRNILMPIPDYLNNSEIDFRFKYVHFKSNFLEFSISKPFFFFIFSQCSARSKKKHIHSVYGFD